MIAFLIGIFLFSSGYQAQKKFDYCQEKNFEGDYCKFPKKIKEISEK